MVVVAVVVVEWAGGEMFASVAAARCHSDSKGDAVVVVVVVVEKMTVRMLLMGCCYMLKGT